jgi:hypothetical protein
MRWLGLAALMLVARSVEAHPQGFHLRTVITLTATKTQVLLTMDVDSGTRCLLIREAADEDRDGVLRGDEVKRIEKKLVSLLTKNLKLDLGGAPLPTDVKESKVSLRGDLRANDTGFSVVVLIEVSHPHPVPVGSLFHFENVSPDLSAISVELFQPHGEPLRQELESGKPLTVPFSG